jgi:hypothetical protein
LISTLQITKNPQTNETDPASRIERQIANVEKKIWRFKKNRNRPIDLLMRVRDKEIPQVQSKIQAYNAVVDVDDAQRNAMILSEYVDSRSMPVFRRSYGFEIFLERFVTGKIWRPLKRDH